MRVLIPLLRSLIWMRIYRSKAMLSHRSIIMNFLDTLWPDRVPWQTLTKWSGCLPLCEKIPILLCQRKVCQNSGIWFSFERWLMFWCSNHNVFTCVSCVVPGYGSSWIMIFTHMDTGKRVVVVRHCVTVVYLTLYFYVLNARETLSSRWRIPLWCKIVENYIPFLNDACAFVLPFLSHWVLAGPHDKEKCAYNQSGHGCVQMCIWLPVDVKD